MFYNVDSANLVSSANAQSRPVFLEQNKQKTDLQRLLRYALTILPIHSSNDDAAAGVAEAGGGVRGG